MVVNLPDTVKGRGLAAPCAKETGVELAVVISGRANFRDKANISGKVAAEVKKGSVLIIEEQDGPGSPWYKVTDALTGRKGWVHGDVIKIVYKR